MAGLNIRILDWDQQTGTLDLALLGSVAQVVATAHSEDAQYILTTGWTDKFSLSTETNFDETKDYLLVLLYMWSHDSTSSDFMGRVLVNGIETGRPHRQEPTDSSGSPSPHGSGTDQLVPAARGVFIPAGTMNPGNGNEIKFQFQTTKNGKASTVADAFMFLMRMS